MPELAHADLHVKPDSKQSGGAGESCRPAEMAIATVLIDRVSTAAQYLFFPKITASIILQTYRHTLPGFFDNRIQINRARPNYCENLVSTNACFAKYFYRTPALITRQEARAMTNVSSASAIFLANNHVLTQAWMAADNILEIMECPA